MKRPVVYLILDGWGLAPDGPGNAISLAKTPTMDFLLKNYPNTKIGAGGEAIGLWKGHQGSSEIGHFIIGAGRNVYLPQGIIANAVASGEVNNNKAYLDAINYVKKNKSTLHIASLMSNSGVHSYDVLTHALIKLAKKHGLDDVVVHFLTDGRDTAPQEALVYLDRLQKVFDETGIGRVGTITGRYWIMDRDNRWERVEAGYNTIANGKAEHFAKSAKEAIEDAYKRAEIDIDNGKDFVETDEFISPTVIVDDKNQPVGQVKDGDALIWANLRTDRAIEITKAFVEPKFCEFKRDKKLDIHYVCTFEYYEGVPAPHAYERELPTDTLGEIVSKAGLKQFRVTETEKWIYVTTIFSGMREEPFPGEDRKLIPSDKIATYDLQPKMHTIDIAKAAVAAIESEKYDLILINFNNPDIIGHTGNIPAAIIGIEECDKGVKMLAEAVKKKSGLLVISADHGNAEVMLDKDGSPEKQHTANLVPFIIVDDDPDYKNIKLKSGGAIKDVTPTILQIIGVEKPKVMTGESLIV